MTGEFSMIIPAMIATSIAYLVAGNVRIYENQVPTRADSPAHRGEYTIPLMQTITVGQAMRREVATASPDESILDAEKRMAEQDLRGLPVVGDGRLAGMFTATDALTARQQGKSTVGQAMSTDLVIAYPADSLHSALQRMTRAGISRLPVVEREHPDRLIGILTMRDLAAVLDLEVNTLARLRRGPALGSASDPLRSVLVREAMRRKFVAVPQSLSLKRVANRLAASGGHAALVVDDEGALTGVVTLRDIEQAAVDRADHPVDSIATRNVIIARPRQSIAEALGQRGAEGLRQLPVVEDRGGKLFPVGLLSRSDVLAAYLRSRDRQAQIARRARSFQRSRGGDVTTLDLLIGPSDAAAGRSLAELELPAGAVITSVLRNGAVLIPRGQLRLKPGDRVQVLASVEAREEAQKRLHGGSVGPAPSSHS
jgi:CBS domain-containing protein